MAGGISDSIELFIKEMLSQQEKYVELQRNELAAQFRCAPSQINYVLSTRFTTDHGYRIESRRGGGGYVRIVRINMDKASQLQHLIEQIGDALDEGRTNAVLKSLALQGVMTVREYALLTAMLSGAVLPGQNGDHLRAMQLKAALNVIKDSL